MPEKDHGFPVSGPIVFDHVSFAVENDDSLFALRETLDAAGFWVSDVFDHGIIHSIYSFDPNGIPIEFSAPVDENDLGVHPRLVDNAPTDAALEGPAPVAGIWPKPSAESAMDPDTRRVYPGEGQELLNVTKKNRFT